MEFVGNAGMAKTTVARILAGIFWEIGLLAVGDIVEVGRADLIGKYTGHTADKVKSVFKTAKGKILFIDEAYSLVDHCEGSYADEGNGRLCRNLVEYAILEYAVRFYGSDDCERKGDFILSEKDFAGWERLHNEEKTQTIGFKV